MIYLGGDEDNIQLFAIETCDHGDHPQPYKVLIITKDVCGMRERRQSIEKRQGEEGRWKRGGKGGIIVILGS